MRPRKFHCLVPLSLWVYLAALQTPVQTNSIRLPLQRAPNVTIHLQPNDRQVRAAPDDVEYDDFDDRGDDEENSSVEAGRGAKGSTTSDAFNGYYDFVINEGSYKFWSAFQIFTAALLIYSAFAAIYYAKYNYEPPEEDDYGADILFKRSGELYSTTPKPYTVFSGLTAQTFQRIMDAISSKQYT